MISFQIWLGLGYYIRVQGFREVEGKRTIIQIPTMICSDVQFLETLVLEGYFLSTNGGVGEALNIGWGAQRKPAIRHRF